MKTQRLIYSFFVALIGAVSGVYLYTQLFVVEPQIVTIDKQSTPMHLTSFPSQSSQFPDLTFSAEKSVNAVVHVMTKTGGSRNQADINNPFYDFFFGPKGYQQPSPILGSGSGVILSSDGYIVTNNHVVNNAHEIEVILNDRRKFNATLIGSDPTSDIALLKIEASELPFLNYGNSDELKIGEWVLAVGNPFNLTSTVTAGIVSAKARSINIIANGNQPLGIESFIQTDAAVNPGNSGGALVNQKGELIGINTAIASRTGSFSGYSFAVPISIVKKVVSDLREFGTVQRGLLGVTIVEVTDKSASELEVEIDKVEGVFVVNISENGGAKAAGIQSKDIIISVNGELVNTVPQLQEKISIHRPGDKIELMIKRNGKKKTFEVTLRNNLGTTGIVSIKDRNELLGATFEPISQTEKNRLRISNGIKVSSLLEGKLKESGVKEGYIITKANKISVSTVEDLSSVANTSIDGLFISGLYPNGRVVYYAVNFD